MKSSAVAALTLALLLMMTASLGCEPVRDLAIENQTGEVLTIYWLDNRLGDVEPGKQIVKRGIPGTAGAPQRIVAKNGQGETVFSKELTFREMQYVGKGVYKVVIPPSQGP